MNVLKCHVCSTLYTDGRVVGRFISLLDITCMQCRPHIMNYTHCCGAEKTLCNVEHLGMLSLSWNHVCCCYQWYNLPDLFILYRIFY